ncbi:MAG: glycosyltransferase family 4 protein [Rhodospirillales bacterium]|nr:glycosyltransferase family 4 protein [Rhodospirillales bacterium]
MRITLVDDSIPFDGYTPGSQPLGGAEKGFASLPGALVRRGHTVQVFNRCRFQMTIEGARWETWETARPLQTDVLIAFRKPNLLEAVRQAGKRILWLTAPAGYLDRPAARRLLDDNRPTLAFIGHRHRETWRERGLPAAVIPPGLRFDYLGEAPISPAAPPRAVVTTHPLHGLDWLLRMWVERIHKACPEAQLHVYSNVLDRGSLGGDIPDQVKPVLAQALAAAGQGVVIKRPEGDMGMAEDYRAARVHLYPGHPEDMGCFTLMETQACGLPAVARPLGAAPERIVNGQTGYLVPDDEAFVNVALRFLTDDDLFWGTSREARLQQGRRSWDDVAAEFENIWAA